jgi:hypothetical protein
LPPSELNDNEDPCNDNPTSTPTTDITMENAEEVEAVPEGKCLKVIRLKQ